MAGSFRRRLYATPERFMKVIGFTNKTGVSFQSPDPNRKEGPWIVTGIFHRADSRSIKSNPTLWRVDR